MTPRWIVIADDDFGKSIELSRTGNLYTCAADADYAAEQSVLKGSRMVYVFKLESVYVPENGRMVEIRQVSLASSKQETVNYGGSSSED